MEANKLRRSKTETFKEMVVDVDGALTAPAAKTSATGLGPSFAGALHGAGITALESRLKESGASINIVGSTEPRMANAGRALSSALGISDQILPDPPVIRLRRKIKARLDVEHRIWVPLPAATFQHEPTAIILLTATEVLAHLAKGSGALAKLIPRVKAGLASSGGVHQTQAFQLFFIVVGLQVHFRKKAQKNDQDWRRAVQAEMAKEDAEEAGAEATTSAPARKRKAPAAVDPAAEVTQEDAEIEMLRLTMEHGVYVIHAKALVDAVEAIVDIVGDVGIRPYKMIANSHLPFCTDVSRTGTSATDEGTYLLMLQQIPRVTEPAARAIQCEFPTVRLLMEAYDEAMERDRRSNAGTSSKNGSHVDNLVAECVIRNRVDGKASSRKVGQAMSKRIGMVLTGDDPLALL
ncbi:hypothetical protein OC846_004291 [Tilletia horrida]|uniref:ERCC4 domain-containing protein n=1 Tax=Tilletia horrida TaxID=155126 RepID=A0AAN6GNL4_9BASI|nr:hypothetical protein OC846_004291 [Tilletia horrida]